MIVLADGRECQQRRGLLFGCRGKAWRLSEQGQGYISPRPGELFQAQAQKMDKETALSSSYLCRKTDNNGTFRPSDKLSQGNNTRAKKANPDLRTHWAVGPLPEPSHRKLLVPH